MTHQDYIVYSFLISGIGIGGLILWSFIRAYRSKAMLKQLENQERSQ